MIVLGLRLEWLGTKALSWRDLLVLIKHRPATSALSREVDGEDAGWDLAAMLAAGGVDELRMSNWLNSEDGSKGINRPEPIPRPGLRPVKEEYDPLPVDEMLEWLGWDAPDNASELDDLASVETSRRGGRKLTPEQVRQIRDGTETRVSLAGMFGVSVSTIGAVLAGRTYRDII